MTTPGSNGFLQNFEAPDLWDLMNQWVYRSGAALYDQLLQDQMEEFKAKSDQFELDFTKALESIEADIQNGETNVQRTIVIPVDIETDGTVDIEYVLDVNHKVNISVNQTLTAQYEQEVEVITNEVTWSNDPVSNYSRSINLPDDGDEYRLALFDNDELTGFRKREGFSPNFEQLEAVEGEGSVALSPETFEGDGSRVTFTILDADRALVDSFGKGGSDYALYNVTDDTFGGFEGSAGTGRNITIVEPEPIAVIW